MWREKERTFDICELDNLKGRNSEHLTFVNSIIYKRERTNFDIGNLQGRKCICELENLQLGTKWLSLWTFIVLLWLVNTSEQFLRNSWLRKANRDCWEHRSENAENTRQKLLRTLNRDCWERWKEIAENNGHRLLRIPNRDYWERWTEIVVNTEQRLMRTLDRNWCEYWTEIVENTGQKLKWVLTEIVENTGQKLKWVLNRDCGERRTVLVENASWYM